MSLKVMTGIVVLFGLGLGSGNSGPAHAGGLSVPSVLGVQMQGVVREGVTPVNSPGTGGWANNSTPPWPPFDNSDQPYVPNGKYQPYRPQPGDEVICGLEDNKGYHVISVQPENGQSVLKINPLPWPPAPPSGGVRGARSLGGAVPVENEQGGMDVAAMIGPWLKWKNGGWRWERMSLADFKARREEELAQQRNRDFEPLRLLQQNRPTNAEALRRWAEEIRSQREAINARYADLQAELEAEYMKIANHRDEKALRDPYPYRNLDQMRDFLVMTTVATQDIREGGQVVVRKGTDEEISFHMASNRRSFVMICSQAQVVPLPDQAQGQESRPSPRILCRKPVVYLYPTRKTTVSVTLEVAGPMVSEYPVRKGNKWTMIASPDGTLQDPESGKAYPYLFWEAQARPFALDPRRAHHVRGPEARAFLEKVAERSGFNFRETTDFVTYWLPALERNPHSMVQILDEKTYGDYARMTISPTPDTLIRLFMIFRATDATVTAGNPEIPVRTRSGYTVVEWGGSNLDEAGPLSQVD